MPGILIKNNWILLYWIFSILPTQSFSQTENSLPVYLSNNGTLSYTPDEHGNRIPDFSYCGYDAGESDIPDVPVKIVVTSETGDATLKIQHAIDYVSELPLDEYGFRGTILLEEGIYKLMGRLKINASGIVLRGSGSGKNGTILLASGTDRETLIRVTGKNDITFGTDIQISDLYVPVNNLKLNVEPGHSLKEGDQVIVVRPTTKEWVDALNMASFGGETDWLGWKPGRDKITWFRTIMDINEQTVLLDVPITTALDSAYGGGSLIKYTWPGRISNVGIECLSLRSEYDTSNLKDEDHCWMAVTIENAMDCWVRQISFGNFAGSAVAVYETARQVTVEDCISVHPVSEIGGQRRYTFYTSGQQTLFQRCYAEKGYHDFAVGNFAAGPNAFVQCESHLPYSFSGTIDRWASGVLFDLVNIDGHAISFKNRMQEAQGAGWTAANSMIWQSSASLIECYSPPTAVNWAFGTWGQFAGNGFWYEANSHIKPRSLYYAQLYERTGENALKRAHLLPVEYGSTSSPSTELAQKLTSESQKPQIRLVNWIDLAAERNPVSSNKKNVLTTDEIGVRTETQEAPSRNNIRIENGWLLANNSLATGIAIGVHWWRGTTRPYIAAQMGAHITRFVPGKTGLGYTDDLNEVTDWMQKNNILVIDHNYGLWYDRRRDDHVRTRRLDGDVWPPFYELPFARSGEGIAWDGLSKYDLTKPNLWYWKRLKDFANLADQKGLILIHQNYFQHNILEAGAHWADFPWRSANNINNTGFPEPPPYAGDKRIFMAEQFYDISNPVRRELHKKYIVQCLDNFSDNSNVIQSIGAEYTGPLHFVEFWLDVIAEWEKENGRKALVALSTTKDVQDAILSDKDRSALVDIIDIRYWHYRKDGSLYSPDGGVNLAPRQHARLVAPGSLSFESVYRAVKEYKDKYPDKVITYSESLPDELNWAVLMAGGSMAKIPRPDNPEILTLAIRMKPLKQEGKSSNQWILSDDQNYIIYSIDEESIHPGFISDTGSYNCTWIDPQNGHTIKVETKEFESEGAEIEVTVQGHSLLWITNNKGM